LKILVLDEPVEHGLGASYARAFRQLGHEVTLLDPVAELRKNSLWRFRLTRRAFERQIITASNQRWIDQLSRMPAEMVWVGKGAWAVPWLWQELKRRRPEVKLVCYNADNPITTYSRGANLPWITESIPCFDFYCTYNKSLLDPLRRAGAKSVERIPFAWDPELHPELEPSEADRRRYGCDVIFIGNGDAYREKWMKKIMAAAKSFGWRFSIYGDWTRCRDQSVLNVVRARQVYGLEMVKAVRSAKIAINILRIQNEGSHNMRTFEIPGCGGLMISQQSPEQEEFFTGNQAAVYFESASECVTKMRELIENEQRRQQIADAAHQNVRRHTYLHRAATLLNAIGFPCAEPEPYFPSLPIV
jgi:spore maturation protein CgeB